MLIFVNNIPVNFVEKVTRHEYDFTYNLIEKKVKFGELKSSVLLLNATYRNVIELMEFLQASKILKVSSIDVLVKDEDDFKRFIKKELSFVKAAGGVVENHLKSILFIKRLGLWDLPKGKAEGAEKSEETALREVEEECNITVFGKERVATTWHTYFFKGVLTLKRTKWYDMGLISDSKMKPQTEEGIEDIQWIKANEIDEYIKDSYLSIKYVIQKWRNRK